MEGGSQWDQHQDAVINYEGSLSGAYPPDGGPDDPLTTIACSRQFGE